MRLSIYIEENLEPILQAWEDFARSIQPPHRTMDVAELRDHAEEMLREIAEDLDRPRSDRERLARSMGESPSRHGESAAEVHAALRLKSGFTIEQLVAEYRALRTSVLYSWSKRNKTATAFEVEDITRFNEALDQALAESVVQYSKMERQAQDIFIGILGHDIRTPLNAISIGAETLMRTESLDGKYIKLASRIFNSSARINRMVSDLLDFTKARFGMQISAHPINMGHLTEQLTEEIRSGYPDRTIALAVSGELDGAWDGGRISQAICNVINNALQHGSQEEPVSVSLNGTSDEVVIAVHNFGMPIPEDEIEHIFDPMLRYARTPNASQNKYANLGLGLYIAREVVAAHGGAIHVVSSNCSDGTTFAIHLPKRKP
ncbi:ATP-binding protein [Noviherbaspirillum pedocola]|uniref:histidine kinase n=1 Tax=Noviherbaspirillum pedocola TaxID=2801341 RepID=A0A934W5M7_9BURK|nr:sensor histidine kinase [Noviherbaspirillum pedocola]MBK4735132.1 sensor histidine kinase [Noviherbaspirillum pedocola]